MSAIRTGTRLEQLQALHRRTTVQLEHGRRNGHPTERHAELLQRLDEEISAEKGRPTAAAAASPPRPTFPGDLRTAALLQRLGATPKQVKQWAVDQGLIPAVARGRVAHELVRAYADHHHEQQLDHPRSETPR